MKTGTTRLKVEVYKRKKEMIGKEQQFAWDQVEPAHQGHQEDSQEGELPVEIPVETHLDPSPCRIPHPEGATQEEDPPILDPQARPGIGTCHQEQFHMASNSIIIYIP